MKFKEVVTKCIRQNARFGDNFWSEDHFHMYLLRVMCSWAVVYEVVYLPTLVFSSLFTRGGIVESYRMMTGLGLEVLLLSVFQ